MTDEYATRREFDQLAARVNQMDMHGTRGVSALSLQVNQMAKDLAQYQRDNRQWQEEHATRHEDDIRERRASRRWRISTVLAALVVCSAFLGILVDIAVRVHGIG